MASAGHTRDRGNPFESSVEFTSSYRVDTKTKLVGVTMQTQSQEPVHHPSHEAVGGGSPAVHAIKCTAENPRTLPQYQPERENTASHRKTFLQRKPFYSSRRGQEKNVGWQEKSRLYLISQLVLCDGYRYEGYGRTLDPAMPHRYNVHTHTKSSSSNSKKGCYNCGEQTIIKGIVDSIIERGEWGLCTGGVEVGGGVGQLGGVGKKKVGIRAGEGRKLVDLGAGMFRRIARLSFSSLSVPLTPSSSFPYVNFYQKNRTHPPNRSGSKTLAEEHHLASTTMGVALGLVRVLVRWWVAGATRPNLWCISREKWCFKGWLAFHKREPAVHETQRRRIATTPSQWSTIAGAPPPLSRHDDPCGSQHTPPETTGCMLCPGSPPWLGGRGGEAVERAPFATIT
ncbi:hypothetical protein GWK47_043901 [Chionoecetes opilio]|uniref:Uncharacterized protein n=1 Tax=Chionoecetes opilio TaxID=41210 RepID=A0A8J4Y7C2_CHIOP|nr:hypothetical protein GWK47_043901 [Chionoecetes opilio]